VNFELVTNDQILKNEGKPAHELCAEKDLSAYSRFTRDRSDWRLGLGYTNLHSYGEFMTLFSKTVAERTRPGQRQDIEEKCIVFMTMSGELTDNSLYFPRLCQNRRRRWRYNQ
jgi:hypothetical protein